jgi:hypothetical protein
MATSIAHSFRLLVKVSTGARARITLRPAMTKLERAVPVYWQEHDDARLQGFDGVPIEGVGKSKAVTDDMEGEFDEAAVERPAGT